MTEIVYFDSEKRAYGQQYEGIDIIADIDIHTWSHYSDDPVGTTWDIIDGMFVELKPKEEIKYERESTERSYERGRFYDEADKMIAKHSDFVALGRDPTGSHAQMIVAWRTYKMDVRETPEQTDYPYDVVYPEMPEE